MMKRVVLLACSLLALSCSQDERAEVKEKELANQVVDNFHMQESKSGKRLYSLAGRRAFYYDKRSEIVVLEPNIIFYGPARDTTSEVLCDSGVVNNRTGDLVAYGHVVVTTQDSTILYTDSLVWFNRRAQIETDAPVLISSKEGTIHARGLISDANLERIEIKEKVKGTTPFEVNEEGG